MSQGTQIPTLLEGFIGFLTDFRPRRVAREGGVVAEEAEGVKPSQQLSAFQVFAAGDVCGDRLQQ
jgi:hypothetical protein